MGRSVPIRRYNWKDSCMWFVKTIHQKPDFYAACGKRVRYAHISIEWTNNKMSIIGSEVTNMSSSVAFIKNEEQAITALNKVGISGYSTKKEAKLLTKTLPHGSFKYLRIK